MGKRFLASFLLLLAAAAATQATEPARIFLVRLNDHEPSSASGLHRGGDNSWTLSTSGGGAGADPGPDRGNGASYASPAGERAFRVREGERFRLELPTVQSMQFHVPVPAARVPGAAGGATGSGAGASTASTGAAARSQHATAAAIARAASASPGSAASATSGAAVGAGSASASNVAASASGGASGAASNTASSAASNTATGASSTTAGSPVIPPSVSGVVYYEAVGAFQARLRLRGSRAVLELTPILAGTVRASSDPPPGAGGPVAIEIELGRWTGLGGGDGGPPVGTGGAGTRLAAAPVTEDSVWIRVDQDRPDASPEDPGVGARPGDTRIGTSPRP